MTQVARLIITFSAGLAAMRYALFMRRDRQATEQLRSLDDPDWWL